MALRYSCIHKPYVSYPQFRSRFVDIVGLPPVPLRKVLCPMTRAALAVCLRTSTRGNAVDHSDQHIEQCSAVYAKAIDAFVDHPFGGIRLVSHHRLPRVLTLEREVVAFIQEYVERQGINSDHAIVPPDQDVVVMLAVTDSSSSRDVIPIEMHSFRQPLGLGLMARDGG